jgi:hypothetical protein
MFVLISMKNTKKMNNEGKVVSTNKIKYCLFNLDIAVGCTSWLTQTFDN